jgi:hypothetical protein
MRKVEYPPKKVQNLQKETTAFFKFADGEILLVNPAKHPNRGIWVCGLFFLSAQQWGTERGDALFRSPSFTLVPTESLELLAVEF